MFDWFLKLFGSGKVKFYFKTIDGREGTVKTSYIGDISTLDVAEIKHRAEFETNLRFKEFRLIDVLQD